MNLTQGLRQFLEYLEVERGRAPATLRNYEFYLNRFVDWAGKNAVGSPATVTAEKIRQYRLWLNRYTDRAGNALSKSTQNYHLVALRSWLKYFAKTDVKTLSPEKVELAKQPEREVVYLEFEEVERLLAAPFVDPEAEHLNTEAKLPAGSLASAQSSRSFASARLRDKAILELLFSTGMRVSEAANLKIEDVNLKRDEFTVRGKGGKLRVVFLSDEAKSWLKKYQQARHDTSEFLFIRHDRAAKTKTAALEQPLTPRSIQRLVDHYARAAGITKPVSPHAIRHSYATDLLRGGADIRSVQRMLGHASVATTQIYTHISDEHLKTVYKASHAKQRRGSST